MVSILREPQAGVALEHASERLRKDKTVVLAAVSRTSLNVSILQFSCVVLQLHVFCNARTATKVVIIIRSAVTRVLCAMQAKSFEVTLNS